MVKTRSREDITLGVGRGNLDLVKEEDIPNSFSLPPTALSLLPLPPKSMGDGTDGQAGS